MVVAGPGYDIRDALLSTTGLAIFLRYLPNSDPKAKSLHKRLPFYQCVDVAQMSGLHLP